MIMGNFKKLYVGTIETEYEAALLYDSVAILSHGLKVHKQFLPLNHQNIHTFSNRLKLITTIPKLR